MRTSHKRINKLISEEKSKITDAELFSSRAYSAYLTDIVEATLIQDKKKIFVQTIRDSSPGADVAYTDNRKIVINVLNRLTESYPTRNLKNISLIGLLGHEKGHVDYTDFTTLSMFLQSIDNGTMYPHIPADLEDEEKDLLEEYMEAIKTKDEITLCIAKYVLHGLANILEDVYIEERVCTDFPGDYKTGIRLNNVKLTEESMSISEQIAEKIPRAAILKNSILQYARIGDICNNDNYHDEMMDTFYDCLELIDEAVDKVDAKLRYDCANRIFIKMWPYVKEWIEEIKKDPSKTPKQVQEMLDKLSEKLGENAGTGGSSLPKGSGSGIGLPKGSSMHGNTNPGMTARGSESREAKEVLKEEGDPFELKKTDDFDEGYSGGVEYNRNFAGTGYKKSADDIERLLKTMSEGKAEMIHNEEFESELQELADSIRYGNAHKGIKVIINRMPTVSENLISNYKRVSEPLLMISKRLQRQIMPKLKDESEGGRMNGLYMGRRLNVRAFSGNDGKVFYNNKLPEESSNIAVAILNDESGSMSGHDRVTCARATSIVLHDFCTALNIPVAVYGHTEYDDVELYAYAEFDNPDPKDKYRIMDISARSGNRDGAALRFVGERLAEREEQTKLLFIISDGKPAGNGGYTGTAAEEDLRGIKKDLKNRGVTLFAAAIGADKPNIERIYQEGFLDITDLNQLPALLTKLVVKYLKNS